MHLKNFTDYSNANFKEIFQISLYCGDHTSTGFHLILIHNNIIISDRHIAHISNDYLKKLFNEEKINSQIRNKCNKNEIILSKD